MELDIHFSHKQPKFIQIYETIRQQILHGDLGKHTQLPSKRTLADKLNVSAITVQQAYDQLISEGYLYSKERKGYFVAEWLEEWHERNTTVEEMPMGSPDLQVSYSFKNGQVDAECFPYHQWLRIYREKLQTLSPQNACWQGETVLRQAIADYLGTARGLKCHYRQVFIFSGFQQQLMNGMLFLKDAAMGVEEPGFLRAKAVLKQLGRSYVPVSVDEHGCTVPSADVRCLYTTPAHQFPTGRTMPISRRVELLNWARNTNSLIIEDDYDSEFRYVGTPVPTLAHLDQLQHVIYFGTFSKTLLPSFRMSYMVLPAQYVEAFEAFNSLQKSTVSKIDQHTLAEFMNEGLYTKHIAKMRVLYRKKRAHLLGCINKYLGEGYLVKGEEAGLHIVLELPEPLTEERFIEIAQQEGISLDGLSAFYEKEKPTNSVIIGYGEPSLTDIEKGIKALSERLARTDCQ